MDALLGHSWYTAVDSSLAANAVWYEMYAEQPIAVIRLTIEHATSVSVNVLDSTYHSVYQVSQPYRA